MGNKKTGLKVNRTAAEKIPLRNASPLTEEQKKGRVKTPHKSLFSKLQSENVFVSGTGFSNKIADIFGSLTNSKPNRQFNENELPAKGVGRMQQMEDVIAPNKPNKDYTIYYLAAAAVAFFLLTKKS